MKMIKTGLVTVFACSLLMMSGCATDTTPMATDATPAADTATTSAASFAQSVPSLAGSKWHYEDEQWKYDLEFAPNGVLHTTHPNDKTKDNDRWEQDGVNINFYFNDKFSQYKGVLSGNNLMSGTATNKKAVSWNWKATRAE